ncbi:YncE family protein [Streptomyces sp. NRRL F-4474]|uniref:YncE family protein n=1 Tax=Streptomyces sp. NRRL F-4474 TaxID=1463851 RepID=UPI0004C4C062|nr:hypothetical protein [Streptomyces sp. NRRL F-4474]
MTPDGRTLYVATADADRVSVIRTDTGTPTHSVPVGGGPTPLALAPDGCTVHVGKGPSPRGGPSAYRQSRSRASTAEL